MTNTPIALTNTNERHSKQLETLDTMLSHPWFSLIF
ncbi:MAG: hypothetical protein ACI9KI_000785, partial [Patiriisocius sp.]